MEGSSSSGLGILDWATASLPMPGEPTSGDLHLVQEYEGGALLAAIDGLGHGKEAMEAARAAVATLSQHAGSTLEDLLGRCHESLRGTRGAVMSLATVDAQAGRLSWLGVGDVEGVLIRVEPPSRDWIINRGGVVGFQVPPMRASSMPIRKKDVLVLATDGIRHGFADWLDVRGPPRQIAQAILSRFRKGSDDALVLVARYLGR